VINAPRPSESVASKLGVRKLEGMILPSTLDDVVGQHVFRVPEMPRLRADVNERAHLELNGPITTSSILRRIRS
jgi:hypothetical protein